MPFDGTQLSKVTQILIDGKRRIENGWCKGIFQLGDRVCMIGAIGGAKHDGQAILYLAKAVDNYYGVAAWNDEPGRTKEQVLEAYDRAIALSMQS